MSGLVGVGERPGAVLGRAVSTIVAVSLVVLVGTVVAASAASAGADGATAGLEAATPSPDPQGTIYVADYDASAIDVFAPGATGNVAPERQIAGPSTGLAGPGDVAVDPAGDIYVVNWTNSTITVYAPGASGDAAPIRTITDAGASNDDDMSLAADGTIYVGGYGSNTVDIFAPGASGVATPERALAGVGGVDGVAVDPSGVLYTAVWQGGAINAYAAGANGTPTPIRTVSGTNTNLSSPDDIKVEFNGNVVVSDYSGSIEVFASGASGNATPLQSISGSNTGLSSPDDLTLDSGGNIWVTNNDTAGVKEFASNANGNVAPIDTIAGSNTTFQAPEGVAVMGPTPSATLTTQVEASSIIAGGSGLDTATLANGTTPTGSIVFNLYGPDDSTCTGAPAYTSSPVTVAGNGDYKSPSFAPQTTGTYSWVAEYSGDLNNPPITTPCNDPKESVTVTSQTQFTLSVAKTGSGSGTVTSTSPEGPIDCGSTCSAPFHFGTQVTLSARAASGSTFTEWSGGGCSGGQPTCTVTLRTDQAVTAIFTTDSHTLSVAVAAGSHQGNVVSSPAGLNCGVTCVARFSPGQRVTLSATAAAGAIFTHWLGGGCSGTKPACVVTMGQSNLAVLAYFAPEQPPRIPDMGHAGEGIANFRIWAGEPSNFITDAFDPDGDRNLTFDWNWGDGTPHTCTAPPYWCTGWTMMHTYQRPGTYSVTLTVTDSSGLRATAHDTITIHPRPTFAWLTPAVSGLGAPVMTTATSGGSVTSVVPIPVAAPSVTETTTINAAHVARVGAAPSSALGQAVRHSVRQGLLAMQVRPTNRTLLRRLETSLRRTHKHSVAATLTIVIRLEDRRSVRVVQHIRLRF